MATTDYSRLTRALPFWICLSSLPVLGFAAYMGGWWLLILFAYTWMFFGLMDFLAGLNTGNPDPETPETALFWHRLVTLIWLPIQLVVIYGAIYYATHNGAYSWAEKIGLLASVGILSGSVGIVFSHELMHQKPAFERHLADGLLASVLYSHFRSEHLKVHHPYVGTPRDPVTARYNEGFHRFFPRVLRGCARSAWGAERAFLARKNLPVWHHTNPFWKYGALQFICLWMAYLMGGAAGIGLFLVQAGMAIWQLELVNYIEHYGLTRKHLGAGKYEHCQPHHSWNADQRFTNYVLINLQRHSDHHYKPSRRFPLLQTYSAEDAPQLPMGYAIMGLVAMIPPLWRRRMNPRVRAWRRKFYPEITDWQAYNKAQNPMPK
ncbi:alkane 1-monooxygenase [Amylibacter marinus]|uniref:Alkane 1-monooxygenase n=1 Tax=Amylibacter marinus TaxID=1475483 RepID=A0ABQ5VWF2_9RHOB|nr:alkane 1-monooxygenase [Amylibacter marinus]GLQ35649.1 alkane 1-monooxygenase [Amylibacter marinus]